MKGVVIEVRNGFLQEKAVASKIRSPAQRLGFSSASRREPCWWLLSVVTIDNHGSSRREKVISLSGFLAHSPQAALAEVLADGKPKGHRPPECAVDKIRR